MVANTFSSSEKIGSIVAKLPKASTVFREYHIDFCCGGDRPLAEAIKEQNLDEQEVLLKLDQVYEDTKNLVSDGQDWWAMPYSDFIDYVVNTHHAYLHTALPKISDLVTKILRVHGSHHPELARVYKLFHTLKMDLDQHLIKEEEILFPMIEEYDENPTADQLAKIVAVIEELESEHVDAGDIIKELQTVTNDYAVPADGCSTYRATYEKLHEMEGDLFEHIHLENNILFPRLEAQQYK